MTMTAADGSFQYAGVAPGDYTVAARGTSQASVEGTSVRVREGESASVELVLDPGTMLELQVVDATDAEIRAKISVTDDSGRQMAGMVGFAQLMNSLSDGYRSDVQRVGPLPPGRTRSSSRRPTAGRRGSPSRSTDARSAS